MVDFLVAADTSLTIVGTPTLTGNSSCAGIFTGGRLAVPNGVLPGPDIDFPDEGIVISTGLPKALAFQTSYRKSHDLGSAGDADLDALLTTSTTHEACALEFQFECSVDPCEISFDYVFGSEEYLEFVASPYNDVFAWFLNGKNIAIVPGTDDFVSVDTINDVVNSQYYVNNDPWQPPVPFPKLEADGFTIPLQATGLASSKSVNTMKLVIADNADTALDSWTLMAKKSFKGPIPRSAGAGGDPHFKVRILHVNGSRFHWTSTVSHSLNLFLSTDSDGARSVVILFMVNVTSYSCIPTASRMVRGSIFTFVRLLLIVCIRTLSRRQSR